MRYLIEGAIYIDRWRVVLVEFIPRLAQEIWHLRRMSPRWLPFRVRMPLTIYARFFYPNNPIARNCPRNLRDNAD